MCGTLVLPTTLKKTGGMCMPCYKKVQARSHGQIFISYRREDFTYVERMSQALAAKLLSTITIFLDTKRLQSGNDWSDEIYQQLNRSNALLVVIGPSWSKSFSSHKNEIDIMLREIEWALEHKRSVLPILIGDTIMPSPKHLPESISPLFRRQAMRIDDKDSFDIDVDTLASRILDLIAEYDDVYSAGYIGRASDLPKPSSYSGSWHTTISSGNNNTVILDFRITDRMTVTGFYTIEAQGLRRSFTGECTFKIESIGKLNAIVALHLIGFIEELGPFDITIPIHEKRGDTYVGVTQEGYSIWSKQIERSW